MEMVRNLSRASLEDDEPTPARPRSRDDLPGLDQILKALAPREELPEPPRPRHHGAKRDLAAALELIHHAATAVRSNEARAQDLEARMRAVAERAGEELKAADMRVQAAEARARAADARVQEVEGRLKEAEDWLARIHDVIVEEFSSRQTPGVGAE